MCFKSQMQSLADRGFPQVVENQRIVQVSPLIYQWLKIWISWKPEGVLTLIHLLIVSDSVEGGGRSVWKELVLVDSQELFWPQIKTVLPFLSPHSISLPQKQPYHDHPQMFSYYMNIIHTHHNPTHIQSSRIPKVKFDNHVPLLELLKAKFEKFRVFSWQERWFFLFELKFL